ncbi:MAG: hypothetical protein JXA42_26970 [Anaerolineales bacterium]|nr:hypothetical protein [Anaerolineales bacterium]
MKSLLLIIILLLLTACQPGAQTGTLDYPVTVFPTVTSKPATPTDAEPVVIESPTVNWDNVTLLPFDSEEPESGDAGDALENEMADSLGIPDPLIEDDLNLLIAMNPPFELSEAEITLGRLVLPVDLFSIDDAFTIGSIEVNNYPGWRFLAFDFPLPEEGELGPVIRAPISGEVLAGAMEMINNQVAQTISIDHSLGEDQLLRMTYVYGGEIDVLFVTGQYVQAGEVLFRLTRDTERVFYLGSTPVFQPDGAVLTLHASIDTVTPQESGVESLKFLRPVSLTPANFLQDVNGWIISPTSN